MPAFRAIDRIDAFSKPSSKKVLAALSRIDCLTSSLSVCITEQLFYIENISDRTACQE